MVEEEVVVDGTSIGAASEMRDPLPDVIGHLREDGNQIHMSQAALAEVANILGQKAALPLILDPAQCHPRNHPHLVVVAMKTAGVDQSATPFPQTDETAGGPGEVQTTVIEIDPLPAVIHRAHELPEETEDKDPSPAVFPRLLYGIGAREDIPLGRGQDLSLQVEPAVT